MDIKETKYFKIMMVCSAILVTTPISVLFYQSFDITFEQIMIIKTATFWSTILFEVPSGYLADKMGYKRIIQVGLSCLILSCVGNAFGHSLINFLICGIVWGMGVALLTGPDEAWYYNFLQQKGLEHEYGNAIGKILSSIQFVSAVALILSSALFLINRRLPYIFNSFFFIAAIGATLKLNENASPIKTSDTYNNKTSGVKTSESVFKVINRNNIYFICSEVIFVATTIFLFETYQPQMMRSNVPVSLFGVIYFAFTIITGFGSRASRVVMNGDMKKTFSMKYYLVLALLQATTIGCLGIVPTNMFIVLIIMGLQEFLYGFFNAYSNAAVNSQTDSKYRATLISIKSLLTSGSKSLIFLVGGNFIDKFELKVIYVILAVFLLSCYFIIIVSKLLYGIVLDKKM